MPVACSGGLVDLVKWSDVHSIGTDVEAKAAALAIGGTSLTARSPIFGQPGFTDTWISYTWIWRDDVTNPCDITQIDDHFFDTERVFTAAELWALNNDRLYFIGASAGTGENANDPCFCCLVGKVFAEGESYSLVNYDLDGSCVNAMNFSNPCSDGKNLLNGNYLQNHPFLNMSRRSELEVGGYLQVVRDLCAGESGGLVYYYRWVSSRNRYELKKATISRLWGYFVWNIARADFQTITDRLSEICSLSCGAQQDKFYENGSSTARVNENCPVTLDTLIWNVPNSDPGCLKSSGNRFPWDGSNCGASNENDCPGQPVYCNTLQHLQSIAAKLSDLNPRTTPCVPCVVPSPVLVGESIEVEKAWYWLNRTGERYSCSYAYQSAYMERISGRTCGGHFASSTAHSTSNISCLRDKLTGEFAHKQRFHDSLYQAGTGVCINDSQSSGNGFDDNSTCGTGSVGSAQDQTSGDVAGDCSGIGDACLVNDGQYQITLSWSGQTSETFLRSDLLSATKDLLTELPGAFEGTAESGVTFSEEPGRLTCTIKRGQYKWILPPPEQRCIGYRFKWKLSINGTVIEKNFTPSESATESPVYLMPDLNETMTVIGPYDLEVNCNG